MLGRWPALVGVSIVALAGGSAREPSAETARGWQEYLSWTDARVERELASDASFLALEFMDPSARSACRRDVDEGRMCVIERQSLTDEGKPIQVPGGMVHHWLGSLLIPGAKVDDVLEFVQRYDESAGHFDEVEDSRLLGRDRDTFRVFLRLRRTKGITVHYHTEHEVTYRRIDALRAVSRSVATRIRELDRPGAPNESEKPRSSDRGFLWELASYWRFQQTERGTVVECETVSLSRGVPPAARWLLRHYLDSVPKESLASTLLPLREHLSRSPIG